jgi:hypothetical protein
MPDFSKGYASQIFDNVIKPTGAPVFLVSESNGPWMPWWQKSTLS